MTNPPDLISEDIHNNVIQMEAIVRLLEAKGLMTEQEILEEVRRIKTILVEKKTN